MPSLTPPRNGIPIATVTIQGREYEAQAHPEWMRFLTDGLFYRVGGVNAPNNNDLDSFLQFDIREADAAELQKRVANLEEAAESQTVSLQAELAKRLDDVEAAISHADSLRAQVAELSAKIKAIERQGAFR